MVLVVFEVMLVRLELALVGLEWRLFFLEVVLVGTRGGLL